MSEKRSAAAKAVDADLETMVQLTARMMRGIKGGHDGAEELVDRVRAAGPGPGTCPR
ncbi:hypothetical protein LUX57_45485 [Actinomadura madurae]|uniref:hypothetical protein n=1 Tax=Actinomadura madurae TaxID=1993 RepID=UPI0020D211A8|nr:hypothetical protein [Actinomadura madurae]MCP9971479.1 hypothetical protein [Actinomadura madurae]